MPDLSYRITAQDDTGSGISAAKHDIAGVEEQAGSAGGKLSGLGDMFGKVALAAGGMGLALGAKSLIGDSLGSVEELAGTVKKLQTAIGGTPEDASRLSFALKETGVGGDEAIRSLDRFSKGLSGLQENEDGTTSKSNALVTKLKDMGIAAEDASGNALPMNTVLGQLADRFKDMPNGAEKTALAMQLFGKSGVDLIPFLNKGRDGLADLERESDKLGLTLSGSTLQSVKDMTVAHRTMDAALEGVKVQIGIALIPAMTALAQIATQLAVKFNEVVVPAIKIAAAWLGEQLGPIIAQVQSTVTEMLPTIEALARQIGEHLVPVVQSIVQWLQQHRDVAFALGAVLATLVFGPIAALIGAAVLIARNWQDIVSVWNSVLPVLVTLGNAFAALGRGILNELQPLITWFQTVFLPEFDKDATAISNFFQQKIIPAIQALISFIQTHWAQISSLFQGPLDIVKAVVQGTFDTIRTIIEGAMRVLGDILTAAMAAIHGDWSTAWTAIKDIPLALLDTLKSLVQIALTELAGIVQGAWETIKAQASVAWDAISTVVTDALHALWSWITANFVDAVKDAILQPFNYVSDHIGALLGTIVTEVEKLPGQIVSGLGDLSNTLWNAGVTLIQGFINGIGSMFGAVQGKLGDLKDKLTSWKGPPAEDAKLLYGNGQITVQGFIDGAASMYPAVQRAFGAVAGIAADASVPGRIGSDGSGGGTSGGAGGGGGGGGGLVRGPLPMNDYAAALRNQANGSLPYGVGRGVPTAPAGAGSIVFNVSALDARGVQSAVPDIARQIDIYLKRLGQPGLAPGLVNL